MRVYVCIHRDLFMWEQLILSYQYRVQMSNKNGSAITPFGISWRFVVWHYFYFQSMDGQKFEIRNVHSWIYTSNVSLQTDTETEEIQSTDAEGI